MRNHHFVDMPPACMDIFRIRLLRGVVAPVSANETMPVNVDEVPPPLRETAPLYQELGYITSGAYQDHTCG